MSHRVTLIPGDGTGPEIAEATRRVLDATGVTFDWDVQDAGYEIHVERRGQSAGVVDAGDDNRENTVPVGSSMSHHPADHDT